MFKIHRHRGDKSGERVDFRFSGLCASQVPKGWDRLSVFIISVESGKTVAKSGKASVRNESCQWLESLSESVWITPDDASKEPTKYPFKFVLTMGTTRFLGESIINLADYMSTKAIVPVSLLLDKCNHGTTLQVKVQCLTPKSRFKNQLKETSTNSEDVGVDSDGLDNKSEESFCSYPRSLGSSSSNHLEDSRAGELISKDNGNSASGSYRSSDSGEIPVGRGYSPSPNNIDDPSLSNHSSFNSRAGLPNQRQVVPGFSPSHALAPVSIKNNNSSSKDLSEAAEDTIDELRAEAKMWERNARKLKSDMENLRKDFSEKSRRENDLGMELSAAFSERDSFKLEVDQLKKLLDESLAKQKLSDNPKIFSEDANNLYKQLEHELKFQKEANSDLSNQLQKTQESNLELVSILQEMEETLEKQKSELSTLVQKEEFSTSEKALEATVESLEKQLEEKNQEIESEMALRHDIEQQWSTHNVKCQELVSQIESLTAKVQELERDCNELTDENLELIYKLKQFEKDPMATGRSFDSQSVSDDFQTKLNELELRLKEKELAQVELTLYKNKCADLEEKIQHTKVQSFDHDVAEREKPIECGNEEIYKLLYQLKKQIDLALEDCGIIKSRHHLIFFTENTRFISDQDLGILFDEFHSMIAELSNMVEQNKSKIEKLGNPSLLKKDESRPPRDSSTQLEVSDLPLQLEKVKLGDELEKLSSKKELNVLNERSVELEASKEELESHVTELEEENLQLSERIPDMEAQLRYLTHEKESSRLEIEDSHHAVADLKKQIENFQLKLDAQKLEMKQKIQDSFNRISKAEEELQISKRANSDLQVTIEKLMEEGTSVQRMNQELRRQREVLQEKCTRLESNKRELQNSLSMLTIKIENLDSRISSMDEEVNLREEAFSAEIDELLRKHDKYEEKALEAQSFLSERYLLKLDYTSEDNAHQVLRDSFNEMHSKVNMYETDMSNVRLEAANKIQELTSKVSAFQEKEQLAAVAHEQTMRLMEDLKLKEESYKSNVGVLETKLKFAESTRQQLVEDLSYMKAEVERVTNLQEEVLTARNSLDTMKYENSKLEDTLRRINEEFEEFKEEKASLQEKASVAQKALLECEEAKRSKVALEEKILRLEGDLAAREALSAQDAGLKNELSRLKRANSQFQRKVQQLEQEKEDCLKKSLVLEEKLREKDGEGMKEALQLEPPNGRAQGSLDRETTSFKEDKKILGHQQKQQISVEALLEKVQTLEAQLVDAAEANNMYKEQLKSFISRGEPVQAEMGRNLKDDENRKRKPISKRSNSSLEAELKDLRERYFHMSLRYAEVEAEKEDLVMKVKASKTTSGKGWFTRG